MWKFADLKEVDYTVDDYSDPWSNDRRPILMDDEHMWMGQPGGHHLELAEQIFKGIEEGDAWNKMQNLTPGYWVSKENAGKSYYEEPEGGFYFLVQGDTVTPEQLAMAQHHFPGEPIYAYNSTQTTGLWQKLAADGYQIVEVGSVQPETRDLSSENHDAWVLDRQTNTVYYMRNAHHLDLMMELREQNPDLAAQFLQEYGRAPNERFLFGDVSYDDFGSLDIEDYDSTYYTDNSNYQNRPPELDAALVNFYRKKSATELIRNIVTVETKEDEHGFGNPFILADNGSFYVGTSSASHNELVTFIMDEMGMQGDEFWDWYDAHQIVSGRMGEYSYTLYYSAYPNLMEILPEIKDEIQRKFNVEEVDSMFRVAAQYRFVHVPSARRPITGWDQDWRSLIIDNDTHTVYYGDPNKFHNSVIEGIEDLAGTDALSARVFWDSNRWIAGEYTITSGKAKLFGSYAGVQNDLTAQIEAYFKGDQAPPRVTHIENPWHILRKPFRWDENQNTIFIGESGTGYLYRSSFTLDTQIPNVVKEALVKLTINQAEDEWLEDDEEWPTGGYWGREPNFTWWTSWIWDPNNEKLIIRNRPSVNHTQLLSDMEETWPESAVFGIISVGHRPDTDEKQWAIVPYYSDAAMYGDEDAPEFLERGYGSKAVDDAIAAVNAWLQRVRHLSPNEITVHEAATEDDPVNIVDLGDWQDRGITWVYNPEDNTLAIAPWNRLHASVIREVWDGQQMEDRQYEWLIAGTWSDPSNPAMLSVVYGQKFYDRPKAVQALENYVAETLGHPKTSAASDHVIIVDTEEKKHHGMGWPFLYDEQNDLLYFGNSEAFHSDLIESMGPELMNDIWLRYYQENKRDGVYIDEMKSSILGGRYDPQNTFEPFYFYDFTPQEVKERVKDLVSYAIGMVPPIDHESSVKTATKIENIDTTEEFKDDDVYGDRPSNRIPFIYVSTRDTIYIGSLNSHHVHVIYSVFDSNNPEDEQEMYEIEDDPGNLGVILPQQKEIRYWGEPQDNVIAAMQQQFPDYPQKIYDDPHDMRVLGSIV